MQFLKNRFNLLTKSTFVKNVLTVASGTAIAQLIGILFAPFITRIYGPEAFGVLGVFLSLTGVIVPIVSLTLPMAIVLPKNDYVAKSIAKSSVYIGVTVTIIITALLFLFGNQILSFLNMDIIESFIYFIPFLLLFSIGQQVMEQWIIRTKQFRLTASVSIIQALFLNGSKIGLGLLSPKSLFLILMTTLGQAVYFALLLLGVKQRESKQVKELEIKSSKKKIIDIIKEYKDFPIYRAPQVLVNTLSQNLPTIILSMFFGPAAAGFYAIGRRIVSMPSQIIGNAVGNVFYPKLATTANERGNISLLVIKATSYLMIIGAIPFGVIIFFGPALFSFVFGDEWEIAGEYARWMSLWMYFGFINNPSVRSLPIISGQKFYLIFTNINVIVSLTMLIIGSSLLKSDIGAIFLYSIAGVILNVLLIILIIQKCRNFDLKNI